MGTQQGNQGNRPNRVLSITVHLERGQDDDLITTLNAVPKGHRATVVKKALRGVTSGAGATAFALPQQMLMPGMAPDHSVAFKELAGDMAWMKQAITNMPDYLEHMVRQVVAHVAGAAPQPPPELPPEPERERASKDVLDQRSERMKKRGW